MSVTGHIEDKRMTVLEVKPENGDLLPEDRIKIALVRFDHGEYCVGVGYNPKTHSWMYGHYHGTGIDALVSACEEFNKRTW